MGFVDKLKGLDREKKIHLVKLVIGTVIASFLLIGMDLVVTEEYEIEGTVVHKDIGIEAVKYTILNTTEGELVVVKGDVSNGTHKLVRTGDMVVWEQSDPVKTQIIPWAMQCLFGFLLAHMYLKYRKWKKPKVEAKKKKRRRKKLARLKEKARKKEASLQQQAEKDNLGTLHSEHTSDMNLAAAAPSVLSDDT